MEAVINNAAIADSCHQLDRNLLSASQTLRVSIITIYSVHSSKVCRPVAGGGATVAPFDVTLNF